MPIAMIESQDLLQRAQRHAEQIRQSLAEFKVRETKTWRREGVCHLSEKLLAAASLTQLAR
jgi:hypothetical protein